MLSGITSATIEDNTIIAGNGGVGANGGKGGAGGAGGTGGKRVAGVCRFLGCSVQRGGRGGVGGNGGRGGGMSNNNNSNPTVTNCTFSGNWIGHTAYGAAMYNEDSSPTVIYPPPRLVPITMVAQSGLVVADEACGA